MAQIAIHFLLKWPHRLAAYDADRSRQRSRVRIFTETVFIGAISIPMLDVEKLIFCTRNVNGGIADIFDGSTPTISGYHAH